MVQRSCRNAISIREKGSDIEVLTPFASRREGRYLIPTIDLARNTGYMQLMRLRSVFDWEPAKRAEQLRRLEQEIELDRHRLQS